LDNKKKTGLTHMFYRAGLKVCWEFQNLISETIVTGLDFHSAYSEICML